MGSYQMFPQIPFILYNFVTDGAVDPLRLDMHVDNVLLEIEAVRESFPAVVTEPRLHTAPPLPGVGGSLSHCRAVVGLKACWTCNRDFL